MKSEYLDGRKLYGFLKELRPDQLNENALQSHARAVRHWRDGGAATVWTADVVLTKLDLALEELPWHFYRPAPVIPGRPPLTSDNGNR